MPTPFLAHNLVKLPRLTTNDLSILMRQIETNATIVIEELQTQNKQLPEFVKRAIQHIEQTRQSLDETRQINQLPQKPSPEQSQSDRAMDNAWRSFEAFLRAWCLLEDEKSPGQQEAQDIYDLVIGDGMGFLTFPLELEWQETKKRLDIFQNNRLEESLKLLGGERFLRHLQKTFQEYGEALQITTSKPTNKPAIQPLWEASHNAVRQYFAKVVALEDPDDPASQTLVKRLLQPILTWKSPHQSPETEKKMLERAITRPLKVIPK